MGKINITDITLLLTLISLIILMIKSIDHGDLSGIFLCAIGIVVNVYVAVFLPRYLK